MSRATLILNSRADREKAAQQAALAAIYRRRMAAERAWGL